jgi:Ca2+-binding RTX toxin-like protein
VDGTRVRVDGTGAQPNGVSGGVHVSADGRYWAFFADASNLVPEDTNNTTDGFVHDRVTGATTRVSVNSSGAQANGVSGTPLLSADGRHAAFWSAASNLVPGDTNNNWDVFVRELGRTSRTCGGREVTISGTAGRDVLTGTAGPDVIDGLGGNDRIVAGGRDDIVCGGAGNDYLSGGWGADALYGGLGDDEVHPGSGADLLDGGGGADRLYGELDADTLRGGPGGPDRCHGGPGSDRWSGCEQLLQLP